jgi:hypothetical protein
VIAAVTGQILYQRFGCHGIEETCGSHLHGAGSRQHEFHYVERGCDSAHANHRNFHGVRRVLDHAQRDGLDSRAREAGGYIGNSRTARFRVNRHGEKSIDQGDGVGARFLCHIRHLRNRGDVG